MLLRTSMATEHAACGCCNTARQPMDPLLCFPGCYSPTCPWPGVTSIAHNPGARHAVAVRSIALKPTCSLTPAALFTTALLREPADIILHNCRRRHHHHRPTERSGVRDAKSRIVGARPTAAGCMGAPGAYDQGRSDHAMNNHTGSLEGWGCGRSWLAGRRSCPRRGRGPGEVQTLAVWEQARSGRLFV